MASHRSETSGAANEESPARCMARLRHPRRPCTGSPCPVRPGPGQTPAPCVRHRDDCRGRRRGDPLGPVRDPHPRSDPRAVRLGGNRPRHRFAIRARQRLWMHPAGDPDRPPTPGVRVTATTHPALPRRPPPASPSCSPRPASVRRPRVSVQEARVSRFAIRRVTRDHSGTPNFGEGDLHRSRPRGIPNTTRVSHLRALPALPGLRFPC